MVPVKVTSHLWALAFPSWDESNLERGTKRNRQLYMYRFCVYVCVRMCVSRSTSSDYVLLTQSSLGFPAVLSVTHAIVCMLTYTSFLALSKFPWSPTRKRTFKVPFSQRLTMCLPYNMVEPQVPKEQKLLNSMQCNNDTPVVTCFSCQWITLLRHQVD